MTLVEMWETVSKVLPSFGERPVADDRENEYDTATPGDPRPMTGLWHTLSDEQKTAAVAYDGPEQHAAKQPL